MIAASALKQELVISGLSKKLMSRLNQSFSKVFQTISAFRRKFLDPKFLDRCRRHRRRHGRRQRRRRRVTTLKPDVALSQKRSCLEQN